MISTHLLWHKVFWPMTIGHIHRFHISIHSKIKMFAFYPSRYLTAIVLEFWLIFSRISYFLDIYMDLSPKSVMMRHRVYIYNWSELNARN